MGSGAADLWVLASTAVGTLHYRNAGRVGQGARSEAAVEREDPR